MNKHSCWDSSLFRRSISSFAYILICYITDKSNCFNPENAIFIKFCYLFVKELSIFPIVIILARFPLYHSWSVTPHLHTFYFVSHSVSLTHSTTIFCMIFKFPVNNHFNYFPALTLTLANFLKCLSQQNVYIFSCCSAIWEVIYVTLNDFSGIFSSVSTKDPFFYY